MDYLIHTYIFPTEEIEIRYDHIAGSAHSASNVSLPSSDPAITKSKFTFGKITKNPSTLSSNMLASFKAMTDFFWYLSKNDVSKFKSFMSSLKLLSHKRSCSGRSNHCSGNAIDFRIVGYDSYALVREYYASYKGSIRASEIIMENAIPGRTFKFNDSYRLMHIGGVGNSNILKIEFADCDSAAGYTPGPDNRNYLVVKQGKELEVLDAMIAVDYSSIRSETASGCKKLCKILGDTTVMTRKASYCDETDEELPASEDTATLLEGLETIPSRPIPPIYATTPVAEIIVRRPLESNNKGIVPTYETIEPKE